jgi:hypothetical protein
MKTMNTNKHLVISGFIFTLVLLVWPLLMAISQPSGSLEEQLAWVVENQSYYKLQFAMALLIGPSILYMMIAQLEKAGNVNTLSFRLGTLFLGVYLALNCISYGSQVIVVPALLEKGMMDQVSMWYFGSSHSVSYFLNQMGYFFWALGTLTSFTGLLAIKGQIRLLSILYIVSALLSIVAFIGLIIDNPDINSLTFPSGLLLFPTGIITMLWGFKKI